MYAWGRAQRGQKRSAAQIGCVWMIVYTVAFWLPALSSLIRRPARITDHSGWWVNFIVKMVPNCRACLILLFFLLMSSSPRNRFGTQTPYGAKGKRPDAPATRYETSPQRGRASRRKILEYYRKKYRASRSTQLRRWMLLNFTVKCCYFCIVKKFQEYEDAKLNPACKTFQSSHWGERWVRVGTNRSVAQSTRWLHLSLTP